MKTKPFRFTRFLTNFPTDAHFSGQTNAVGWAGGDLGVVHGLHAPLDPEHLPQRVLVTVGHLEVLPRLGDLYNEDEDNADNEDDGDDEDED